MSAQQQPASIIPISPRQSGKLTEIIKRLVARRADLRATQEDLAGEIEGIDAQLLELLDTVGTHDVDGTKIEVRQYARTDYDAIEKAYPAGEYPQLYATKTALNQDAVKRQFAPAALDDFKVLGKKSVVIR